MKLLKGKRESLIGYLFLMPALVFFFGIMVYPLIMGISLSFCDYNLIYKDATFVGLDNYKELIQDDDFWLAFKNTVLWSLFLTLLSLFLGLGLALILNKEFKGRGIVRALWLLPWAVPTIVASLSWSLIYEPEIGVLNYLLRKIGLINSNIYYLADSSVAFVSVMITALWHSYPFSVMALLGGLQSIPYHLYEAAEIDGAGTLQKFFYITIPSLRSVIGILTTLQFIWNFNHFDIVWQLTQGGPGGATTLLSTIVYFKGFRGGRMGYGSAIAVVMLIFLLVFSYFYFKLYREGESQ